MAKHVLTHNLSEPLDGTKIATVDIDTDSGNLTIDALATDEQLLASATLEYFETQGIPTSTLTSSNDQATLTLRGGGSEHHWFRLPWEVCGGAYEWQIHLNPTISSDITARSGGGNVTLNLTGMAVTRLSADTGGGNMDVVLPDNAANLSVTAKTGGGNVSVKLGSGTSGTNTITATSGGGNVVVHVPGNIAAKVDASSGLGKVIVDSRFSKTDNTTYQSPDYDAAANTVEITAQSGAGNVRVTTT